MLQMAQRKNTELDDEHWCLFEICEIPNLIFKSQTRKYSNIQRNKNKKEPKMVRNIGGK